MKLGDIFSDTARSFADQFNTAVANLDNQVAALRQSEADLWAVQPEVQASGDPSQIAEWNAAMNKVIAMNSTIDSVQSQIVTVVSWWNSAKQSFGVAASTPGALARVNLGLFPAIPWGVIALLVGGTTAIAGVIYAAQAFLQRWTNYKIAQANIAAAQTGGAQVDYPPADPASPGLFDGLGNIAAAVPWLIGGAVVLMVLNRGNR